MKEKIIKFDVEAKDLLFNGVKAVFDAVSVTLGPSGQHMLIRTDKAPDPIITKDGVTVAMEVWSADATEMLAIEFIRNVSKYADAGAGDGTTTAMVLAYHIFKLGQEVIKDGDLKPFDVVRGMREAVKVVTSQIKENSIPADNDEMMENVAMISTNNDKDLAKVVLDAFKISGDHGVVMLKESQTNETHLVQSAGMSLPIGYMSPHFINRESQGCVNYKKPAILLTDRPITDLNQKGGLVRLIQECAVLSIPLLIMCKDMDMPILEKLISSYRSGSTQIVVTKCPGFGHKGKELLKDIGIRIGCVPFLEDDNTHTLDNCNATLPPFNMEDPKSIEAASMLQFVGSCEEINIDDRLTSIKGGDGTQEEVDARLKVLRAEASVKNINQFEKSELQTRISCLANGIAYIHIGGYGEAEIQETRHRLNDALHAVLAAKQEGVLPGGGVALKRIAMDASPRYFRTSGKRTKSEESKMAGAQVVLEACNAPFDTIMRNVGLDANDIWSQISFHETEGPSVPFNIGYDAQNEYFGDMIKLGVIDPAMVTRVALENAVSISSMLLNTAGVIIEPDCYKEQAPAQQF